MKGIWGKELGNVGKESEGNVWKGMKGNVPVVWRLVLWFFEPQWPLFFLNSSSTFLPRPEIIYSVY